MGATDSKATIIEHDEDYAARSEGYGLASKQAIFDLLKETPADKVFFLDVRSEAEFTEKPLEGQQNVVYAQCTMSDASKVTETAEEILPDKSGKILRGIRANYRVIAGVRFRVTYPLLPLC